MELIHKLTYNETTTVIDEPIGFDDLKMTMKRHDYHGMGAEMSLGNLEFYGQAFHIIKQAYEADIDSEVLYEVYADTDLIYTGKIDLSTYSVKQADYQSVSVKVGEIGVKTTFNNRLETEVDLNIPKTIDGDPVESPNWLNLHIPMKHLLYTNISKQEADTTITTSGNNNTFPETGIYIGQNGSLREDLNAQYIVIPIGEIETNEFGIFEKPNPTSNIQIADFSPQYSSSEDHESKYGENTKTTIIIHLNATLVRTSNGWSPVGDNYIKWHLEATDGTNTILGEEKKVYKPDVNIKGAIWDLSCDLQGELNAGDNIKYYIKFDIDLGQATAQYFWAHITVHKGSYVKMTMYDNLAETPVNADMLLVHDALNVVSHCISENALSVKSEWYRTPECNWNAGSTGGGALKVITNGYHIRGLFTEEGNERNMPLSFKNLIESLNAQDCIGWGFSIENGDTCIRVERWSWFYKNDIILTLNNVAEMQIAVDPDYIPTELSIGYKKYTTNDQYNSIDSPHATRTFANAIKAVSKDIKQECDLIADNYAIEEIRRSREQVNETQETTYDESIFLFEVVRNTQTYEYQITRTAYYSDATNLSRPTEFLNAKLTPRRMAQRWGDFLFATNNHTAFNFIKGEINYKASYRVYDSEYNLDGYTWQSLLPFGGTATKLAEDAPITYQNHAIIQAEKITFSHPLTIAQYQAVKANPYSLVSVNGLLGWILDFKYSFADGTADFTLLAKYGGH